jgi:hypothetical protein
MIKQALENLKITTLNQMQEAAINAAKKSDVISAVANRFG